MAPSSPALSRRLLLLFALASGLSVANVYYAQPLLDALSQDFRIHQSAIGGVVTATQLGCALALLFLVPLGDKVARKKLTGLQLSGLICALVTVGLARTSCTLLAGMLAVGLLGTAMTQGLIAYAASVASESERGRVVGASTNWRVHRFAFVTRFLWCDQRCHGVAGRLLLCGPHDAVVGLAAVARPARSTGVLEWIELCKAPCVDVVLASS